MEAATFSQYAPFLIGGLLLVSLGLICALIHMVNKLERRNGVIDGLMTSLKDRSEDYDSKLRKLMAQSQRQMQEKVEHYEGELKVEREKSRRYLSEKKSTEVRTGHILEKVAPLFEDFPGDIIDDNVIPVFKTFDYLVITDDEIILVEVKSGNAGLSTRQKKVKKLVEAGKVSFRTFRRRGTEGDNHGRKEDKEDSSGQV